MSEHERFSEDCGAYVLGALEEHEAAALRQHMESCVQCRDEVKRLDAVAEVLGLGVPALAAPPELRRRVLDVVDSEGALFAAAEATAPRPVRRRGWLTAPQRGLGGLVGAALALGIAFGALVLAPGGSVTKVIAAGVAQPSRWHATRAPVASLSETGTRGELVVSHLAAAPRGRIYEVWIERDGRVRATDVLFDATSAGNANVAVPDLRGASAVLVTAERRGGALVPTMAPLIDAQLS
jgi:anti-sigma factor RsiW